MDFNVNNNVRVKLTPKGIEILRQRHAELYDLLGRERPAFTPPKVDAEGWSTFQLWVLMREFGAHIVMGAREQPFETTIQIVEQK